MPYSWRYYAAQQTEWGQVGSIIEAEAELAHAEAANAAVRAAADAAHADALAAAVAASERDAALETEREAQHNLEVHALAGR